MDEFTYAIILVVISLTVFVGSIMAIILRKMERNRKEDDLVIPDPPPFSIYGNYESPFLAFLRFNGELVRNLFHTLGEVCATVGAWLLNSFAPHDKPKRKLKNADPVYAIGDDGELVELPAGLPEEPEPITFMETWKR